MNKKITIINLIITTLVVIASSCSGPNTINKINITGYDERESLEKIRNCVKNISLIQLESDTSCMLNNISKILIDESSIYISDSDNLFSFDHSGKFKCKYGEKGNAENEYINLSTFMFDTEGNIVIIDSYTGKLLTFSKEGKDLSCIKLKPELVKYIQNGQYIDHDKIFISNYLYNDINDVYAIIDIKDNKSLNGVECKITTQNTMERIGRHPFTLCDEDKDVSYLIPFSSYVYSINGSPLYNIITSQSILSQTEISKISDFSIMSYANAMQINNFVGFTDIFNLGNQDILLFMNVGLTILDKGNKTCSHYKLESFDIPFSNLWDIQNNKCYSAIMPYGLMPENWDAFKNNYHVNEDFKIDPDGNPVIMTYNLF